MKIQKKIILGFFALLIIVIAVISFIPNGSREAVSADSSSITSKQNINYSKLDEVIFPVKTELAFRGDLIKYISANGIVASSKEIDVVSKIAGTVEKINIYNGKTVQAGDTLLILDNREYLIDLNEAKNKVISAQLDYGFLRKETFENFRRDNIDFRTVDSLEALIAKNEEMFENKKISEDDYLSIKNELQLSLVFTGVKRNEVILNKSGLAAALNQLNRAKLNLSYCYITAPFNGVIADFSISPGQKVSANEKLFKLLDNSDFKVDVGVLENEVVHLERGSKVIVTINALPNKTFEGKIIYINPLIDPQTKTALVTVSIKAPGSDIKQGMYASVKIQSKVVPDCILIPKDALLIRDKRELVFVAEGNLAKWHYVDTGESNDQYIVIKDGVQSGDTVIVEGNYNLAHDARVKIIN